MWPVRCRTIDLLTWLCPLDAAIRSIIKISNEQPTLLSFVTIRIRRVLSYWSVVSILSVDRNALVIFRLGSGRCHSSPCSNSVRDAFSKFAFQSQTRSRNRESVQTTWGATRAMIRSERSIGIFLASESQSDSEALRKVHRENWIDGSRHWLARFEHRQGARSTWHYEHWSRRWDMHVQSVRRCKFSQNFESSCLVVWIYRRKKPSKMHETFSNTSKIWSPFHESWLVRYCLTCIDRMKRHPSSRQSDWQEGPYHSRDCR
jgi:hypothetical protein